MKANSVSPVAFERAETVGFAIPATKFVPRAYTKPKLGLTLRRGSLGPDRSETVDFALD